MVAATIRESLKFKESLFLTISKENTTKENSQYTITQIALTFNSDGKVQVLFELSIFVAVYHVCDILDYYIGSLIIIFSHEFIVQTN